MTQTLLYTLTGVLLSLLPAETPRIAGAEEDWYPCIPAWIHSLTSTPDKQPDVPTFCCGVPYERCLELVVGPERRRVPAVRGLYDIDRSITGISSRFDTATGSIFPELYVLEQFPSVDRMLLLKTITQTIAPFSWTLIGGCGTIEYLPTREAFLVHQTEQIHQQIEAFLTALKRVSESEGKPKVSSDNCVHHPIAEMVLPYLRSTAGEPRPGSADLSAPRFPRRANVLTDKTIPRDQLIRLITQTIAPASWSTTGGAGLIRFSDDNTALIVRQTEEVQSQVADLINKLRKLEVKQKYYTIELKVHELDENGKPRSIHMPKVAVREGDDFSIAQEQCIPLQHGTIRDLLPAANMADSNARRTSRRSMIKRCAHNPQPEPLKTLQTGMVWNGKITPSIGDRVSIDLSLSMRDVDSADRDGIVVTGRSMQVVRKIKLGQIAEVIVGRDAEGNPCRWVEVAVNEQIDE